MSKLNETDIQGFVLRGYNMPFARYLFLHFENAERARNLIGPASSRHHRPALGPQAGQHRQHRLHPSRASQRSISPCHPASASHPSSSWHEEPRRHPRRHRPQRPRHWDRVWQQGGVHIWLGINARHTRSDRRPLRRVQAISRQTAHRRSPRRTQQPSLTTASQPQGALRLHRRLRQPRLPRHLPQHPARTGQVDARRHAGHRSLPANSCLATPTKQASCPSLPCLISSPANGTFMVYRKLHQNVATFRAFLDTWRQLLRRQRKARRQIHRPLERWHAHRALPRPTRSIHREGSQSQHRFQIWHRPRRHALPHRRARAARSSARRLRIRWKADRSPPHHAPRPSLRTTAPEGQPASDRRSRHRLHGAQRQPLPPVRIRPAAVDRVRQRRPPGKRQRPADGQPRRQAESSWSRETQPPRTRPSSAPICRISSSSAVETTSSCPASLRWE